MNCIDCNSKLTDEDYPRCDACIDRRHVTLRGSMDLKYPRAQCAHPCAGMDSRITSERRFVRYEDHRCFLAEGHSGPHEFSSECGAYLGDTLSQKAA